jgi:DNA-binding GntR family transcriptional regulator
LADRVYERLRTAILTGEIRPNQRLVEAELARQLEVSRTPVRESLQRLQQDGLVDGGREGWVVREHTAVEIREIYETRAALEGYAARLAAERGPEELLEEVARIHGQAPRPSEVPREEVVAYNTAFHDAVFRACGNERLIRLIQSNREFYFNYRVATLYTDQELEASIAGHQAILGALLRRDGDRAEVLAREHILESLPIILSRLRLPPEGPLGPLGLRQEP